MKNHTVFALIISFLLFTSENSQSQDAPGNSDHPIITRYAGSVIDGYEVHKFNEFVLPLGPAIQSPEGNRVPSEKKLLEGKITRILYRGPDGCSSFFMQISNGIDRVLDTAIATIVN